MVAKNIECQIDTFDWNDDAHIEHDQKRIDILTMTVWLFTLYRMWYGVKTTIIANAVQINLDPMSVIGF